MDKNNKVIKCIAYTISILLLLISLFGMAALIKLLIRYLFFA